MGRTCKASAVGRAVWELALPKVIEAKIDKEVEVVARVNSLAPLVLDKATVQAQMAKSVAKILEFEDVGSVPPPMEVSILYRGVPLSIVVTSFKKRVELAVAALCNERALLKGLVPPVVLENTLIGEPAVDVDGTLGIEESLATATRILRALDDLMPEQARSNIEILVQLVRSKESNLLAIDPTAAVEILLLTSANEFARAAKLQAAMLGCHPDVGERLFWADLVNLNLLILK